MKEIKCKYTVNDTECICHQFVVGGDETIYGVCSFDDSFVLIPLKDLKIAKGKKSLNEDIRVVKK